MPVPLPPALVGSVFLPRPCTSVSPSVRLSIHSTCSAVTGLVCGPGLGPSYLAGVQPVESGCRVGKVLGIFLFLTREDLYGWPCGQRLSPHRTVARGEDLGKHEPPPGPSSFSLQLQIYASFVLQEMCRVLSQPMEDTPCSWLNSVGLGPGEWAHVDMFYW